MCSMDIQAWMNVQKKAKLVSSWEFFIAPCGVLFEIWIKRTFNYFVANLKNGKILKKLQSKFDDLKHGMRSESLFFSLLRPDCICSGTCILHLFDEKRLNRSHSYGGASNVLWHCFAALDAALVRVLGVIKSALGCLWSSSKIRTRTKRSKSLQTLI